MKCQRCQSERVFRINVKHSDCGNFVLASESVNGYAPDVPGICKGDYTFPDICLECGQTQGEFPKGTPQKLEPQPKCECSDEDRAPHDDGDGGKYCMWCGYFLRE